MVRGAAGGETAGRPVLAPLKFQMVHHLEAEPRIGPNDGLIDDGHVQKTPATAIGVGAWSSKAGARVGNIKLVREGLKTGRRVFFLDGDVSVAHRDDLLGGGHAFKQPFQLLKARRAPF